MKDVKSYVYNELNKGFIQIQSLLTSFQYNLSNLNSKLEDESIEEFLDTQLDIMRSICDSHLAKIQTSLIEDLPDCKKKKGQLDEEVEDLKRR